MSRSISARRDLRTDGRSMLPDEHSSRYRGGAVGEILGDIEQRIAESPLAQDARPARIDVAHRLSVASGYIGLVLALGVAAVALSWVL